MYTEVLLVIGLLLLLLALEVPVAWSLALSGAVGIFLVRDESSAIGALESLPFTASADFLLTIIPMYVLMGMFAKFAGVGEDVYGLANRMLRRVPGGLGVATVWACMGFSAVSGSSSADVATIGKATISEMRKHGYAPAFAAALVAAAGTFAVLIPPSVAPVIYGSITGDSIGDLLLAGIIPGLLSGVVATVFIIFQVRRYPRLISHVPGEDEDFDPEDPFLAGERKGWAGLFKLAAIFLIVIGAIYAGILTSTESAAVGAIFAFFVLVATHRRDRRKLVRASKEALMEAASITAALFAILFGASVFSYFFVTARIPSDLSRWLIGLDVAPWVVVAMILLFGMILGMFLDGLSIMLILVPLTYPVVTAFGFDGVWYGILIIKVVEIGLITPPVGINAFLVASVAKGVKTESVFWQLAPFVALDILITIGLFAFPEISLWLPSVANH